MAIGAAYGAIAFDLGFTVLGRITRTVAQRFGLQPVAG
jgi:hypothetical protein